MADSLPHGKKGSGEDKKKKKKARRNKRRGSDPSERMNDTFKSSVGPESSVKEVESEVPSSRTESVR